MELRLTPSEEQFEQALRAWLQGALPEFADRPATNDVEARKAFDARWQRALHDGGWAGVSWPAEFGGRGATLTEQLVYHEVTAELDAPPPGLNFVGLYHAGPTVMRVGTEEQRRRWLPPVLTGDQVWCQGFSEPDAGSDLASIRTRGVVDGDALVVTGAKIWTSNAHVADLCELIVRTDPASQRHHGLTYVVCEMDTPGIEVRNIVQIDGCPEFNEVVFDEVRIPLDNVLGAVDDGWAVAMTTLGYERSTAFMDRELRLRQRIDDVAALARAVNAPADPGDDVVGRLGTLAAEVEALRAMVFREISRLASGGDPGAEGSVLKLYFSELDQRIGRFVVDLVGDRILAFDEDDESGRWTAAYFRTLSSTIAAGTSQVQRNIVGERILGLPRERSRA